MVTEAGFGADLGAEKFLDIKCRKSGLRPSAAVIVATVRALKYHGGVDVKEVNKENVAALEKGLVNLERHVDNVQQRVRPALRGVDQPLQLRHPGRDRAGEVQDGQARRARGAGDALGRRRQGRGRAGEDRGRDVRQALHASTFVYDDGDSLWDKIGKIAQKVYRASEVTADSKVRNQIKKLQEDGYGHYPVCVAKTQYSFSTDAQKRGAPSNHVINVREVRLAAGAEFIVMVCGDIMTMPGLPKVPSASKIDIVDGKVVGLF